MKVSYNLANQTGRFPREEQEKGREKNRRAGKSRTYVSVTPPVTIPCIWCLSHGSVSSVLVEWTNINEDSPVQMFKRISSRNGSYIWNNVLFQELEMTKEFLFPYCAWAKYSVWTLTGWYWMNSYENVLTSLANWITSQCIYILLHSVSVEVKYFLQLAWEEK